MLPYFWTNPLTDRGYSPLLSFRTVGLAFRLVRRLQLSVLVVLVVNILKIGLVTFDVSELRLLNILVVVHFLAAGRSIVARRFPIRGEALHIVVGHRHVWGKVHLVGKGIRDG